MALVDDDALGEPAAAHNSEDAIAEREPACRRAARRHGSGDLYPGDIRGRPGGCGVPAGALGEVCGVERGVANRDDDLVAVELGLFPLRERDDLVPTRARKDDRLHALASPAQACDRRPA